LAVIRLTAQPARIPAVCWLVQPKPRVVSSAKALGGPEYFLVLAAAAVTAADLFAAVCLVSVMRRVTFAPSTVATQKALAEATPAGDAVFDGTTKAEFLGSLSACVRACLPACVLACLRACVRACVGVCVGVRVGATGG
jgi:hypothetical protein